MTTPKLITMPCGCWASPGGIDGKHWRFCKLHAAAREMLEALRKVAELTGGNPCEPLYSAHQIALAAIDKGEGRT